MLLLNKPCKLIEKFLPYLNMFLLQQTQLGWVNKVCKVLKYIYLMFEQGKLPDSWFTFNYKCCTKSRQKWTSVNPFAKCYRECLKEKWYPWMIWWKKGFHFHFLNIAYIIKLVKIICVAWHILNSLRYFL